MNRIFLLLLVLGCTYTASDEYIIEVAENTIDTLNWSKLGVLVHEVLLGKSEFRVENMDESVYSLLINSHQNPFLFRFKGEKEDFKNLIKFEPESNSFGFVVYTDDEFHITAINVVKSTRETSIFAKSEKGKISYSKNKVFKESGNFEEDDEDVEEIEQKEIEEEEDEDNKLKRNRRKRKRKRKRKKRRKQEEGFIKKNFWYLVIGGLIAYNVMTFDKSKFNKMMEEAKEKQRLLAQQQQGGAQPQAQGN